MKSQRATCFSLVAGLLVGGAIVLAHHGNSVSYDPNKTVTFSIFDNIQR